LSCGAAFLMPQLALGRWVVAHARSAYIKRYWLAVQSGQKPRCGIFSKEFENEECTQDHFGISIGVGQLWQLQTQQAMANGRHHHHDDQMACFNGGDVLPILLVGAALGAVTGGVGSAVVWGSAYAVVAQPLAGRVVCS